MKDYSACMKSHPLPYGAKVMKAGTIIGKQRTWLKIPEQTYLFDVKLTSRLVLKISIDNMKNFVNIIFIIIMYLQKYKANDLALFNKSLIQALL